MTYRMTGLQKEIDVAGAGLVPKLAEASKAYLLPLPVLRERVWVRVLFPKRQKRALNLTLSRSTGRAERTFVAPGFRPVAGRKQRAEITARKG